MPIDPALSFLGKEVYNTHSIVLLFNQNSIFLVKQRTIMIVPIKSGKKNQALSDAVEKIKKSSSTKTFDAYKYLGRLKKGVDALDHQEKARNEWK